jgi:hypothetical protein
MPTAEKLKTIVEKLLLQSVLSEGEINELFQKATNRCYWQNLCPEMGVVGAQSLANLEGAALSADDEARALAHLAKHGYFRLPPLVQPAAIARMCSSVEAVRNARWPSVFTYVYDEFWAIFRTASIARFLSRQLGAGYLQNSNVWTYHVAPREHASGWPPHVDNPNSAGRLTLWIPLSDANIDNGCMYVIPQDRIPSSLPTCYQDWKSISGEELATLLHNVRPLPAAPGSVLGWNHALVHWGGQATDLGDCPRISIAVEFLHEDTRPGREESVFDLNLPSFSTRIRVIGEMILQYKKLEPIVLRYRDLATKLIEWGNLDEVVRG